MSYTYSYPLLALADDPAHPSYTTLVYAEDFEGTLGAHTVYTSNVQISVALTTSAPLVGAQSLRITRASGSGVTKSQVVRGAGQTHGRLLLLTTLVDGSSLSHNHGLTCMQSVADLTGGSGTGYGLRWRGNNLDLVKYTTGLALPTTLATTALTQGSTLHALQLLWCADQQGALGGTLLTASHGTATDFSAMTEVLRVTDTSSPLTTSSTQGVTGEDSGSGASFDYRHDQLALYI